MSCLAPGQGRVALVPLDDRPCNRLFPGQVARICGFEVLTPPRDYLGRFLIPGNGYRIGEWLLEVANQVDAFAVSLDMLAYGGLIAERTPDVTVSEALRRLAVVRELRRRFPSKLIVAFIVVQRLSVTSSSPEMAAHVRDIHRYSQLADLVERHSSSDHRAELAALEQRIPRGMLMDYLHARQRNHAVSMEMLRWAADGVFDFLGICQEDSAPWGLHVGEQQRLAKAIEEMQLDRRALIYCGADEESTLLAMRCVCILTGFEPRISLWPLLREGLEVTADFEDRPVAQTIEGLVAALTGSVVTSPSSAHFTLFVNTPLPLDQGDVTYLGWPAPRRAPPDAARLAALDAFVAGISSHLAEGRPVAIADVAYTNRSDPALVERLCAACDLTRLDAYGGWNRACDTVGVALAQAAACALVRQSADETPDYAASERALCQQEFLLYRFVDDWVYQGEVRAEAMNYARDQGCVPEDLRSRYPDVERYVQERLEPVAFRIHGEHFEGRPLQPGIGSNPLSARIGPLEACRVSLPWPRTFEVEVKVEVRRSWSP